mgnify:CR=1 FL=1
MKQIILSKSATGWNAQFINDPDVLAAFGTDTIPTAYTAAANASTVLDAIARLNPNHVVSLAHR